MLNPGCPSLHSFVLRSDQLSAGTKEYYDGLLCTGYIQDCTAASQNNTILIPPERKEKEKKNPTAQKKQADHARGLSSSFDTLLYFLLMCLSPLEEAGVLDSIFGHNQGVSPAAQCGAVKNSSLW